MKVRPEVSSINWLKRRLLFALIISIFSPLVLAAIPIQPVQAADGGSALWIDRETIRYPNNGSSNTDGAVYIRHNGDNFFRQGDLKNLCSDNEKFGSHNGKIYADDYKNGVQIHLITKFSAGDSRAVYRVLNIRLYSHSGTELRPDQTRLNNDGDLQSRENGSGNWVRAYYGCQKAQEDSPIVLQQAQRSDEGYKWINSGLIETSDSRNRTYTKNDGNDFIWLGDGNTCKEYLEVAPNSSSGTLKHNGTRDGANVCRYQSRTIGISQVEKASVPPGDPSGDSAGGDVCTSECQSERNCKTASKPFAWIFCPAIKLMNGVLKTIFDNWIVPLLKVKPLDRNVGDCNGSCTYKVWSAFKNLANAGFVLIFLIVIFANVASINIDAYTIKKLLPRLVAAAILLQFSFVFSSFIVDVGNILGGGVNSIINTTLRGIGNSSSSTGAGQGILSAIATGTTIGVPLVAGAIIAGPTLLIMGLGLLVSVLIFVATLAVRQIAITMLVVLSPIAIMLWVLPNTEKYFKEWLDNFTKLVLMYPIIMLIVGAGRIVEVGGADAGGNNIKDFFVIAAPTISLLMLPAAFKVAGEILQRGGHLLGGKGQGLMGGVKNSQMARDMKSGYKERNFMRALDDDKGRGKRFLGKVATGNFMPGRASQRRLLAGHAAAVRTRGEEHEVQMLNEKYSADDLLAIATSKTGATVKKTKVDEAAKTKAIELLARTGQYEALDKVRTSMINPSTGDLDPGRNRIWQSGLQKNMGDVFQKAPDLVIGSGAFKNMSADKIASLDHTTVERLVTHLGTTAGAADKPIIMAAIQQLADSPTLRNKVDQRVVGVLTQNRAAFSGINLTDKSGTTIDAADFLDSSHPNGRIGPPTTDTNPATGKVTTRAVFKP